MYMVKRLVSLFTLVCLLSACSDNRLEELRKDDSGEQGKAWLTLTISLPSEAVSRSSTGGQGGRRYTEREQGKGCIRYFWKDGGRYQPPS